MRLESKKYLYDMLQAAKRIAEFTRGRSFGDYERDALLRAGVERQFEIIGEALPCPKSSLSSSEKPSAR